MRISDWSADVCSSDLTFYLRLMYERFGYPGLFAAYNAGPARYAPHLRTGRTLPGETRSYLATLARTPAAPAMPPACASGARQFFMLRTRIRHGEKQGAWKCLFIDLDALRDRT